MRLNNSVGENMETLKVQGKKILITTRKKHILSKLISLSTTKLPAGIPVDQYNAKDYTSWNGFEKFLESKESGYDIGYSVPLMLIKKTRNKIVHSEKIGYLIATKNDIFKLVGDGKKRITHLVLDEVKNKIDNELYEYNLLLDKGYSLMVTHLPSKKESLQEVEELATA